MTVYHLDAALCKRLVRHLHSYPLLNLPQRVRNVANQVFSVGTQMHSSVRISLPVLVHQALLEMDKMVIDEITKPVNDVPGGKMIDIYNDFTRLKMILS